MSGPTSSSGPPTTSSVGRTSPTFAGWVHNGDWKPLKALYDSAVGVGNDNSFAVYLGVQCTDAHWPQNYARWRADSQRVYAKAPFVTWDNTWFNAPCLYWPAPSGTPVDIDGSKVQSAAAAGRDARRGDALRGEPRGPQPVPGLEPHRWAGRDDPRRLAVGELVRRRPDRRLPRAPRAARGCRDVGPMRSAPLPQPVPGGGGESAAAAAAAAASGAPSPALRQLLRDRAGPSRLVG